MPTQALGNGHDIALSAAKKEEFLQKYVELRVISKAAEAVGINPRTVYNWKDNDPDFAKAVLIAERSVGDYYHGKIDSRIEREKSDILLMYMHKRYHPEFRDQANVTINNVQIEANRLLQEIRDLGKAEPMQSLGSIETHEPALVPERTEAHD